MNPLIHRHFDEAPFFPNSSFYSVYGIIVPIEKERFYDLSVRRTTEQSGEGSPCYEYRCVKLPPALSREELENVGFIKDKNNLVLYGPVGIGKTHMAIAAGVSACMKGYKVRFYTVTELVLKLAEARKNGILERLRSELNGLDLLILDEWGYVPVDRDGSQLLFRVISDSYESKSLLLTTNLEFSKWGSIFTDNQMAAAMIDRLVHHGHLILFEGNSYRMEHALMKQTARQPRAGAVSRDSTLDAKRPGSP